MKVKVKIIAFTYNPLYWHISFMRCKSCHWLAYLHQSGHVLYTLPYFINITVESCCNYHSFTYSHFTLTVSQLDCVHSSTLNPQHHTRSATYIKRNGLLIRKITIKSSRPFHCAYHPLTP